MAKHKLFAKAALSIAQVEHYRDAVGVVVIPPEIIPPGDTRVEFDRNPQSLRHFDFATWYGVGIDPITYVCQRQIQRFLADQDNPVEIATVVSYCHGGLGVFLDYCVLVAATSERELVLADVDRDLMEGYLGFLAGRGLASTSQKTLYNSTKSVLLALARRGLITLINAGDTATFPQNSFPNSHRKTHSQNALSKRERKAFMVALRQALKPIWADDTLITSELLVYALLTVALHTGRNSTPLLEMERDCLSAHPTENIVFLTLWKRRGHHTSKVALRAESKAEREQESRPAVRTNVAHLIRRVIALTEPLRAQAADDLKERVWLYSTRGGSSVGQVTVLTNSMVVWAIKGLVAQYGLTDSEGAPLRINISRLRKTFANRIFGLTDGDLATTAIALGNTPQVADHNYLAPDEEARRNWQFMGEILVQELLEHTIGATYKETPMGRCGDPVNGQYAPKREGSACFSFTNCLRCKHYAVTADDLYKLFSFYFRVLAERSRMHRRRWAREYAHIPRLIDSYIVAEGLRRGTFKPAAVEAARERARSQPHPFWAVELVNSLGVFA